VPPDNFSYFTEIRGVNPVDRYGFRVVRNSVLLP